MPNTTISKLTGRQVWDSRGRPTVEAEVRLVGGSIGRAIAPAGASRGSHEAVDLRDGGQKFGGMGVSSAIANINGEISALLTGRNSENQSEIDDALIRLDGTENKMRLGGNATIAVSMAVLHAAAGAKRMPLWRHLADGKEVMLPMPEIQIFGGGVHAGGRIDIQDFMVMPLAASSFSEAMNMTADIYRAAAQSMQYDGKLQGVAD